MFQQLGLLVIDSTKMGLVAEVILFKQLTLKTVNIKDGFAPWQVLYEIVYTVPH